MSIYNKLIGNFYITFLTGKKEIQDCMKEISIHHTTAVEFWIIYWFVCLFIKKERTDDEKKTNIF